MLRTMMFMFCVLGLTEYAGAEVQDDNEIRLLDWIDEHSQEAISLIEKSVNINSGTMNSIGVKKVGDVYQSELKALGFETKWLDMPESMQRAGHLVALKESGTAAKILLIGHLDTVFESDEKFHAFRRQGDVGYGPGVSDMKAGNAVIIFALRALREVGLLQNIPVAVIYTGDEENAGSPLAISKYELIELAKWADVALGFESGVNYDGSDWATISRRSSSNWYLEVQGKQAHSSKIFNSSVGAGAIFEASRILHEFNTLVRGEEYLTFNAGTIQGGTDVEYAFEENRGVTFGKTNVVPRKVIVHGDLRGLSPEQIARAEEKMTDIVSNSSPQTDAQIVFDHRYPPMAPTDGNRRLQTLISKVNDDMGRGPMPILDPSRRGAADISFAAPFADSLAGLGALGEDEHTPNESLDLASVPIAIKRTALLLHRLSLTSPAETGQ